jgi:membrane protein implicated in regulation of membrane protease activity
MLEDLVYWHWMVLGFLLLILEMLAPGAILMWFGAGALLVGSVLYFFPDITWEWQIFIFAIFSLASIFIWKKYSKDNPNDDTEFGTLSQRGKSLIGRKVPLVEAITNGVGRVQIDDTFWRAEGDDLALNTLVTIVDADGASLKVEASE